MVIPLLFVFSVYLSGAEDASIRKRRSGHARLASSIEIMHWAHFFMLLQWEVLILLISRTQLEHDLVLNFLAYLVSSLSLHQIVDIV